VNPVNTVNKPSTQKGLSMKKRGVVILCVVLSLSVSCSPATVATPAPTTAPASGVPANWQTYTNPAGFSIQYPSTWTLQHLPDPGDGTIHADKLQGTEGYVELQWGVGFGGACPQGYTTVKVAQGELPTCYTKNADGTETWNQINKELTPGSTGFSGFAGTSNTEQASHDLILQILSTLSFTSWP
jgi:hypothetical protein